MQISPPIPSCYDTRGRKNILNQQWVLISWFRLISFDFLKPFSEIFNFSLCQISLPLDQSSYCLSNHPSLHLIYISYNIHCLNYFKLSTMSSHTPSSRAVYQKNQDFRTTLSWPQRMRNCVLNPSMISPSSDCCQRVPLKHWPVTTSKTKNVTVIVYSQGPETNSSDIPPEPNQPRLKRKRGDATTNNNELSLFRLDDLNLKNLS